MIKREVFTKLKINVVICTILLGCILAGCKQNTNIKKSKNQEETKADYCRQQDATTGEHKNQKSDTEMAGDMIQENNMNPAGDMKQENYTEPIYMVVENPSYEYYFEGEDLSRKQTISLHELETRKNEIIDTEEWFEKNGLEKPGFPYSDGTYTYQTIGEQYEAMTDYILQIVDDASGRMIAELDFSEYKYGETYIEEDYAYIKQRIIFAKIADDVLYVSTGHNTYAESSPQTAYITAISMKDYQVLWKSQPLVCNSYNFEIISGAIVCGYGFTAEDDYLYILDAKTGKIWDTIPIPTKADYIIKKDDLLYVRTYDMDMKYEIEYLTVSAEMMGKGIQAQLNALLTIKDEPYEAGNAYIDTYLNNCEKEYILPNSKIIYRMAVADAAAGSRMYVLLKSRDNGKNWYMTSAAPFGDDAGGSIEFTFINEALGFATLSHNGGDEAVLYVTKDGGKSYNEVTLKGNPEVTLFDKTYQPYDFPQMPYIEKDTLVLLVGQGADGDYDGGDANKVARFVSSDLGTSFVFDGYQSGKSD